MAERPRILLFGCGQWGRTILRDLLALGCEVAVVDPDASARDAALAAGARSAVATVTAEACDGIVVATPTSTHASVLDRLLDGRVPIAVEKPLCDDPAAARRIRDRARCPIHVLDKWRYHPAVRRLAAIARSGELGRVLGLRTRRLQSGHRHADVDALWTLAPHDLTIAREILGRIPPPRSARVDGDPAARRGVIAEFGGDPVYEMEISTTHERRVREIRLRCERGIAVMDDPEANAIRIVREPGGVSAVERLAGEPPLLASLRAFVGFLAGGPPPLGTLDEAIEVVELIAALGR